ncbi:MAG: hypothetical protein LBE62_12650 [Azonexus sp.]|jgi:hypothetical protein|nr:hypothetical protein [Azonexus sp.]
MMKTVQLTTLIFFLAAAPAFPESSGAFAAWTPEGWKLIAITTGDLSQDDLEDVALILEQTNPANFIANDSLGVSTLNLNPRRLVVLLKTPEGYREVLSRDDLLPSENSQDAPCLDDPLLGQGGISIVGGKLLIELGEWLSCGSWSVTHETFTFRLENTRFRLIGYDYSTFHRASGEASEESINYLTGKRKTTTGLNTFENSKPEVSWSRISGERKFYLDKMVFSCQPSNEYFSSCTWSR